jgi:hypothetical protein
MYFLYHDANLNWLNGGEYGDLAQHTSSWLKLWRKAKINLTVCFDGCHEMSKTGTIPLHQLTMKRRICQTMRKRYCND